MLGHFAALVIYVYTIFIFSMCAVLQHIGSKETDQRADEVLRLGIMDVWTPDNHYRWSESRYGGHISAVVESVVNSHLLMCSMFL